jgi:hypothetical protein
LKNLVVIEHLGEVDFFNLTKEQLVRDFSKIGIELKLAASTKKIEELSLELIAELDAMLEHRPDLFAQLLYIMDLSESKVREIIQTSDYTSRDISLPMIYRAGEKVYWRKQFQQ